ncbi:17020_t:CDS:2 [Acaulospora morrowiae]|uniref:17020_t:CDS:1 n=1 Tax=Acaulospora morrowiae TaxID=94023 RepID=A0A9N8WHU5_9GLOM|nr:17020_t:CDS:2 [Acaulospora morrowiae]
MDEQYNDRESDARTLTDEEDVRMNLNQINEETITELTKQMQELAANYAKLTTTMMSQAGPRMRNRVDIHDVTCFKCGKKDDVIDPDEELMKQLQYEEEQIEDTKGYFTNEETLNNIDKEVPGLAVYLVQVEELPITTEESEITLKEQFDK